MARRLMLFMAAMAGPIVGTSAARGSHVVSGNTYLDSAVQRPALDATDNWLVFRTSEIPQSLIDRFVPGAGSLNFDTQSNLTFMYQVANNGDGSDAIDVVRQAIGPTTSWGYFADVGLTDDENWIGYAENMGIDTWPSDGADMRLGGDPGLVILTGPFVNPASASVAGGFLEWQFSPPLGVGVGVSSLLVSTTPPVAGQPDDYWISQSVSVREPGGTWQSGFMAPHVPEPGTVSLLALGGLMLTRRRPSPRGRQYPH